MRTPPHRPADAASRTHRQAPQTQTPHHDPRSAGSRLPRPGTSRLPTRCRSPDTRWCGDITSIPTQEGRLYPATVTDIASPRVVGWATADHLRTELVADALKAATHQRRTTGPVIFHSDRGRQYTSSEPAAPAARLNIRLSVGRTEQCRDNALAESFFATLKHELIGNRP